LAAPLNFTPTTLSILPNNCWLGTAFPDSISAICHQLDSLYRVQKAYILGLSVDGSSQFLLSHTLSIGILLIRTSLCQSFSNGGINLLWWFRSIISIKLGYSPMVRR